MLDEAADLVREEEWPPAEKKYIEIISLNPDSLLGQIRVMDFYEKSKRKI